MTDLKTPENLAPDEVMSEDELVAADDTIIGRAFRWSLLVFLVIGGGIALMVWMMNRPHAVAAKPADPFVPPKVIDAPAVAPVVQFTDITREAGIDFVHVNGATGDKLLPETMGGGCAFLDFDSDGDQDILLINSCEWKDAEISAPSGSSRDKTNPATMALYRNDGSGKFVNVTSGSGLVVTLYGMGVAVGDYDNDGDPDVFISSVGPNHLFRNDNGHFNDITAQTGVAGERSAWSTSAGFLDYDNDGRLDLFVCNYVKWSREIDFAVNYSLTGIGRAYGPPNNFEGANSYLYHNNGDGTFTDVSEPAGIQVSTILKKPMGKALGLSPVDVDGDGLMDVLVANDTVQRFFFHNDGRGRFNEQSQPMGLAFDRNGNVTGAMGVDSAYYRNDKSLGFVIGNFANEMSSLLACGSDPMQFSDEAITEGIGSPTRLKLKFGTLFLDYDLDGRSDILHANGHIEDQINVVQPSQHYKQSAQLFWNAGPKARACYVEVASSTLGDMPTPIVGRGAAYADVDSDGDLDVLLTQIAGSPMLLRNDQQLNHHWVRLKLIGNGTTSNRDAIGAKIELTSGGVTQIRQVMPTRSYLSQVELPVTFGLGSSSRVDQVRIMWPDGATQEVRDVVVDTVTTIEQVAAKK